MAPSKLIQKHLSRPAGGPVGLLVAWFMRRINRASVEHAVASLGLTSADRYLEVGFGSGFGLLAALEAIEHDEKTRVDTSQRPSPVRVTGVELSEQMLSEAKKRLAKSIASGRVELHRGRVGQMSMLDDNTFTHVLHLNCCYFWSPLDGALKDLHRVLVPNGVMLSAVKFNLVEGNDPAVFVNQSESDYVQALEEAGFEAIDVTPVDLGNSMKNYHAITARKQEAK